MSNERELEVDAAKRVAVVAASRALALVAEDARGAGGTVGWHADLLQAQLDEAGNAYNDAVDAWGKFVARCGLSDTELHSVVAAAEQVESFISCQKK